MNELKKYKVNISGSNPALRTFIAGFDHMNNNHKKGSSNIINYLKSKEIDRL